MAEQYIFQTYKLNKYYGQKHVLKDIGLSFFPGAKIGIVGENGSGKSSLLHIMAGLDGEFQGTAELCKGYSRSIVLQEPDLDPGKSVLETLQSAFAEIMSMLDEYNGLAEKMGEDIGDDEMQQAMDRMGELQDELDAKDAWNLDQSIEQASDALCLPEDERIVGTLSGGEARRVALCKALLERPDLLLLDEPTNHLDAETVDWLEVQLREYPGTVIVVTHDRYFLDNVTEWILELDGGHGVPWKGNYSSWIEQKLTKLATQGKENSTRHRAMERELAWIRMSNKNRQEMTRNRLIEFEKLIAREQSLRQGDGAVIQIAPGPELGEQVVEFTDVSKSYDSQLFSELSFKVPKGAIVGLIGPNGTGKTTLFRIVAQEDQVDLGEATLGQTVQIAYVDQGRESLDGGKSLVEEIGAGAEEIKLGRKDVRVRQYLSWFGFKGSDQQKNVDEMSGGERNRMHLAKTLKVGGNLLLLDEPTNDLDVNTLRMLEDALLDFAGCIMLISHDRFFLDRICTHLLVFEGEGKVRWFAGNYRDYESWRAKQPGGAGFENRRKRYRKIVHS